MRGNNKDIQNEAYEFFNNMNDEEFEDYLKNFGVEVEDGEGPGKGKIVFTDETEVHWRAESNNTFSINQSSNFKSYGFDKTKINTKFPLAC